MCPPTADLPSRSRLQALIQCGQLRSELERQTDRLGKELASQQEKRALEKEMIKKEVTREREEAEAKVLCLTPSHSSDGGHVPALLPLLSGVLLSIPPTFLQHEQMNWSLWGCSYGTALSESIQTLGKEAAKQVCW